LLLIVLDGQLVLETAVKPHNEGRYKMKKKFVNVFTLWIATLGFVLAGCSGSETAPPAAPNATVSGVAASGAPIVGTVSLRDSSVPAQKKTTTSDENGSFSFDVNGLKPPYVLKAEWRENNADRLYSPTGNGKANINLPLHTVAGACRAETRQLFDRPIPAASVRRGEYRAGRDALVVRWRRCSNCTDGE
jgi:hypothetical protein